MYIKRRDQRYVESLSMPMVLHTQVDIHQKTNLYFSSIHRSVLILSVKSILLVGLCFFCLACGSTSNRQNSLNHQSHNVRPPTAKESADLRSSEVNKSTMKGTLQKTDSSNEYKEDLPSRLNKSCVKAQQRLYKQAMVSTQEYTQVFLQEMEKLKLHFNGFQLSMRRSQMMIFFGSGLVKRLSMIETIADCLPLYKRYQKDRATLFKKIEISQIKK